MILIYIQRNCSNFLTVSLLLIQDLFAILKDLYCLSFTLSLSLLLLACSSLMHLLVLVSQGSRSMLASTLRPRAPLLSSARTLETAIR